MSGKLSSELMAALEVAHLSKYEAALREAGCVTEADLWELEEHELKDIGMNRIEINRLLRRPARCCNWYMR